MLRRAVANHVANPQAFARGFTRYRRTPLSSASLMSLRRSFFFTTAERKPLTEWACQPETFINSPSEAPFDRSIRARRVSVFEALCRFHGFSGFREPFASFLCATFFPPPQGAGDLAIFFGDAIAIATASAASAIWSLPA